MKTLIMSLMLISSLAFAERGVPPEPTKEQRQKMAANHEMMAMCLKSDKTMKTCHEEMKSHCAQGGPEACPMMGKMMGGMGMGMGKKGHMHDMMHSKTQEAAKPEEKK